MFKDGGAATGSSRPGRMAAPWPEKSRASRRRTKRRSRRLSAIKREVTDFHFDHQMRAYKEETRNMGVSSGSATRETMGVSSGSATRETMGVSSSSATRETNRINQKLRVAKVVVPRLEDALKDAGCDADMLLWGLPVSSLCKSFSKRQLDEAMQSPWVVKEKRVVEKMVTVNTKFGAKTSQIAKAQWIVILKCLNFIPSADEAIRRRADKGFDASLNAVLDEATYVLAVFDRVVMQLSLVRSLGEIYQRSFDYTQNLDFTLTKLFGGDFTTTSVGKRKRMETILYRLSTVHNRKLLVQIWDLLVIFSNKDLNVDNISTADVRRACWTGSLMV